MLFPKGFVGFFKVLTHPGGFFEIGFFVERRGFGVFRVN